MIHQIDWHPAPGMRALFTTRRDGSSRGPWSSFNLSYRAGDDPAAVRRNRALLRRELPSAPCWLSQVHGNRVIGLESWYRGIAADGAWTDQPGQVAVVLCADCLPVLLADRKGSVVAAVHAGWRGLAAGVLEQAVAALPVSAGELSAWIGPGIGQDSFEVGAEVIEALDAGGSIPSGAARGNQRGRFQLDLKATARARLARAGVDDIADAGQCTHTDEDRFFSHRRDGTTGRMAALIWIDEGRNE